MAHINRIKLIDVYASETDHQAIQDFVFTCAYIHVDVSDNNRHPLQILTDFYVSREYNLGDTVHEDIKGRFLFYYREDEIVSFRDENIKLITRGKQYVEWMIACKPEQYYANFQAKYFISAVPNSNSEVVVYHRERNSSSVVIDPLFSNVRFKIRIFKDVRRSFKLFVIIIDDWALMVSTG